jgi:hypothetical protein
MQFPPDIPPELIWAKTLAEPAILALPGVVGVGLGMREENAQLHDELAVRVLVADASQIPPGIPDQVGGVRVCIVERRGMKLLMDPFDLSRYTPIRGGIRISNPKTGFGTLGCVVQDTGALPGSTPGTLLGLTCQHVAGPVTNTLVARGFPDTIWQPKEPNLIAGTNPDPSDNIGWVLRADFPQISTPTIPPMTVGLSDAAVITLDGADPSVPGVVPGATFAGRGTPSPAIVAKNDNDPVNLANKLTSSALITQGLQVTKRGFTTRVTHGVVLDVLLTKQWKPELPNVFLLGVAEILGDSSNQDDKFCIEGDSGALVVNRLAPTTALGLLWGESNNGKHGYITPIVTVESQLGVKVAWAP